MTTPFKAKAEGVLVEVPEDATDMQVIKNGSILWVRIPDMYGRLSIDLPPGDWQLVGTSDTMTEDDWKGIGISAPVDSKRYAVLIPKENK